MTNKNCAFRSVLYFCRKKDTGSPATMEITLAPFANWGVYLITSQMAQKARLAKLTEPGLQQISAARL